MGESVSAGRLVPMRLQKFLARAGVASRRGSEDLMTAGRVRVNGEVVTELGAKVDPASDTLTVDGKEVRLSDSPTYLLLNKPAGRLTTMDDPQGRPTVAELMPNDVPGLFPVGRLDMDTTGALLLTTDGELAHRLMHPSFHVSKTYMVEVEGALSESEADLLRKGIVLDDGPTKPAEVEVLEVASGRSRIRIVISEGRKRQVKRMFDAIGHPVLTLHRAAFGPVEIGDLPTGEVRPLNEDEISALHEEAGDKEG